MIQELFLKNFTMSLTVIPIILIVLIVRYILNFFAPKVFLYALWVVVLIRLLISLDFEMSVSFVPETLANGKIVNTYFNSYIGGIPAHEAIPQGIKTIRETILPVVSVIWIVGIVVLASYSVWSLVQLKKRLVGAVPMGGNIYLVDNIDSPFVIGIVVPKIYLPSFMPEKEYTYMILHEKYHIKRRDYLIKVLAFIALCIHWYNPLVWITYILFTTDMEMSCDEAVLRGLGEGVKAEYSASLLGVATGKKHITATFLAFGEGNPKARIKNVLKWKRPIMVVSVLCAVLVFLLGIICLANPKKEETYMEIVKESVTPNGLKYFIYDSNGKKIKCDEPYYYLMKMTIGGWKEVPTKLPNAGFNDNYEIPGKGVPLDFAERYKELSSGIYKLHLETYYNSNNGGVWPYSFEEVFIIR